MAKPRTVRECIHHWAHQVVHHGEVAAKCGNVSYRKGVLYSYAEPIARFMENDIVLISDVRFSNTTCQHQSQARQALPSKYKVIYAPHIDHYGSPHNDNQKAFKRRAMRALEELTKHPRRKKSCMRAFYDAVNQYVTYSEAFSLDWPSITPEELEEEVKEEARLAAIRAEEARVARAKQIAEGVRREAEDLAKWRAGEQVYRHFTATALRLSADRTEIETSKGARVPVEVAPALWNLANRQRNEGLRHQFGNRFAVGHYNLDAIDADGSLHIGCHYIPYSELVLIAEQLGLKEKEHEYVAPTTEPITALA